MVTLVGLILLCLVSIVDKLKAAAPKTGRFSQPWVTRAVSGFREGAVTAWTRPRGV
jgi:hypothetical protein